MIVKPNDHTYLEKAMRTIVTQSSTPQRATRGVNIPKGPAPGQTDMKFNSLDDVRCSGRPLRKPGQVLKAPIFDKKVDLFGLKQTLGSWIERSGIPKTTVARRLQRGQTPMEALTRPDQNGNCLHPLTDSELSEEEKNIRKLYSGVYQCYVRDDYWVEPRIVTNQFVVYLGKFADSDEGNHAFNVAVDELPNEWTGADQRPVGNGLSVDRAKEITTVVKAIMDEMRTLAANQETQTESPNELEVNASA